MNRQVPFVCVLGFMGLMISASLCAEEDCETLGGQAYQNCVKAGNSSVACIKAQSDVVTACYKRNKGK